MAFCLDEKSIRVIGRSMRRLKPLSLRAIISGSKPMLTRHEIMALLRTVAIEPVGWE